MREAVIVSTARTALTKAGRGALNDTHGITMAGHAIKGALERAGVEAAAVEDVFLGCAAPEGATGHNWHAMQPSLPVARRPRRAPPSTASAPRACRPSPMRRTP
jgi:acetyl-CoA acetyltransferase